MREVVLFCLATLLVDAIPIYILSRQLPLGVQIYPIYGLLMLRAFTSLFVGYMAVKLMKTQRGLRAELSDANNRLARYAGTLEQLTLSRERNRLARELHDVLAHTLSGVAVELEAVKALWAAQPGQAAEMLEHSLQATRAGLTETRRALQALRASPLEDLGLSLAVRGLVESTAGRGGLVVEAQIAADLPDYPPEVEQTVYRVAEEALRNVAEHSGARSLRVALTGSPGTLELLIADDGQGFDPRQVDPLVRFGLSGMRERAEAVGGRLDLDTHPGGGTQIRLAYGGQP
jgi:signal transduction histidine kinase